MTRAPVNRQDNAQVPETSSSGKQVAIQSPPTVTASPRNGPDLVINHLSGRVFKTFPELVTQIPRVSQMRRKTASSFGIAAEAIFRGKFRFCCEHRMEIFRCKGQVPANGDLWPTYPGDFGRTSSQPVEVGKYLADVRVDGAKWCSDLFEVAAPREARPKVINVRAPSTVKAGQVFTVRVEAQNHRGLNRITAASQSQPLDLPG